MARRFCTLLFCILFFTGGCGAFAFSIPAGSSFASAVGPPLPPSSTDVGAFPIFFQFPTAPNPVATFFTVIVGPGF